MIDFTKRQLGDFCPICTLPIPTPASEPASSTLLDTCAATNNFFQVNDELQKQFFVMLFSGSSSLRGMVATCAFCTVGRLIVYFNDPEIMSPCERYRSNNVLLLQLLIIAMTNFWVVESCTTESHRIVWTDTVDLGSLRAHSNLAWRACRCWLTLNRIRDKCRLAAARSMQPAMKGRGGVFS